VSHYRVLSQQSFHIGNVHLVPIRDKDKYLILEWRNEQMFHLRQNKKLSRADQNQYFQTIVRPLFSQEKPQQILFSLLENETCIGYGGLVHLDWYKLEAEISFLMSTDLESNRFEELWSKFLKMLNIVAFDQLSLVRIFTYAYDLREHLYPPILENHFKLTRRIPNVLTKSNRSYDVLIHTKLNTNYTFRDAVQNDVEITYSWVNHPQTRKYSFSQEEISASSHRQWFLNRINQGGMYKIFEYFSQPMGVFRLDLQDDKGVLSYSIAPGHHGKGYGKRLLLLGIHESFSNTGIEELMGYVSEENEASLYLFRSVGFCENIMIDRIQFVLKRIQYENWTSKIR
jgi:RimJ/RimL family protein N-acetyltransferase